MMIVIMLWIPFIIRLMVWFNSGMTISEHDDQWGEPDSMEHDFSVEEMLDMNDLSNDRNCHLKYLLLTTKIKVLTTR